MTPWPNDGRPYTKGADRVCEACDVRKSQGPAERVPIRDGRTVLQLGYTVRLVRQRRTGAWIRNLCNGLHYQEGYRTVPALCPLRTLFTPATPQLGLMSLA